MNPFIRASAIAFIAPACLAQEVPDSEIGSVIWNLAALTIQVKGEDGQPIPGAGAHLGFRCPQYKDGFNDFRGKTDDQGFFHGQSNLAGEVHIEVTKEGYYPSKLDHGFRYEDNTGIKPGDKLMPWNPTRQVMLKKIGKPIPMIVRTPALDNFSRQAPDLGNEHGFDMMRYDWVAPHGKGETADFLIRFDPDLSDPENPGAKVRLRFPNPGDGMIPVKEQTGGESQLKFPRVAPEEGYLASFELSGYRWEKGQVPDAEAVTVIPAPVFPFGYLFRIRTVRDPKTSAILSATYGKIMDSTGNDFKEPPIPVYAGYEREDPPGGKLESGFSYVSYINPTANDRNLEFDTKSHLVPEMENLYAAP